MGAGWGIGGQEVDKKVSVLGKLISQRDLEVLVTQLCDAKGLEVKLVF